MKNIYKSNLRHMTVKNVEINNGVISNILLDETTIREDILFYNGIMGAYISFDYGTRLPDRSEAEDYIRYQLEQSKHPETSRAQCSYVDYNDMHLAMMVPNSEFREMKKQYREAKKRK